MREELVVVVLSVLASGCGRIAFDPQADASRPSDALADAPVPSSCATLTSSCGATASASCCDTAVVSGGTFLRSYDVATDLLHADTGFPASVTTFRLDTYEVTVGRFRAFVDAGQGTQTQPPATGAGAHLTIPNSGWDLSWNANLVADRASFDTALQCSTWGQWTPTAGAVEDRPINCITWYEAMAFCIWDGGFLPTEAEWNYAAAGGNEQRAYPWANPPSSIAIDETRASYYVDGTKECFGDLTNGCTAADIIRVGSLPAGVGRWGHADLAGNVFEWVLDAHVEPYATTTCDDCANLVGTDRVYRGGNMNSLSGLLRGANRLSALPTVRTYAFGVRCARPL